MEGLQGGSLLLGGWVLVVGGGDGLEEGYSLVDVGEGVGGGLGGVEGELEAG